MLYAERLGDGYRRPLCCERAVNDGINLMFKGECVVVFDVYLVTRSKWLV